MPYYKDTGNNVHFLDSEEFAHLLPAGAAPISDEQADAIQNPPPSPAAIKAGLVASVQLHLDAAAQALGYDDIKSAVTYAEEPSVPQFQAECQALRAWRSQVWAACYEIMAEVEAEMRTVPTEAELLAELPPAPTL